MLERRGYVGKILRIDLSKESHRVERVEEAIFEKYLGGRGVAAKIYFEEIAQEVKPLDEANKLIFMSGP